MGTLSNAAGRPSVRRSAHGLSLVTMHLGLAPPPYGWRMIKPRTESQVKLMQSLLSMAVRSPEEAETA